MFLFLKTYVIYIIFIIITNLITKLDILIKSILDEGNSVIDTNWKETNNENSNSKIVNKQWKFKFEICKQ